MSSHSQYPACMTSPATNSTRTVAMMDIPSAPMPWDDGLSSSTLISFRTVDDRALISTYSASLMSLSTSLSSSFVRFVRVPVGRHSSAGGGDVSDDVADVAAFVGVGVFDDVSVDVSDDVVYPMVVNVWFDDALVPVDVTLAFVLDDITLVVFTVVVVTNTYDVLIRSLPEIGKRPRSTKLYFCNEKKQNNNPQF